MSELIRQALGGGPDCPPLEALAAAKPDAAVQQHLESCAHCRSELALFQQFESAEARPEEAAGLAWVEAELTRRRAVAQPSFADRVRAWWDLFFAPAYRGRLSLAAAALLVLVAVGVFVPRGGDVRTPAEPPVWRSGQITAVAPIGDLDRAPTQLRWEAMQGAASYHVRMLEVDGTEIWSSDIPTPLADLPASLTTKMVTGRTFQWEVEARDGAGQRIAATGLQNFHIVATIR